MKSQKFVKPPVMISKDEKDKEKLAEQFINFMPLERASEDTNTKSENSGRVTTKEETKGIFLRLPISLRDDLSEIANITGLSINAICSELLRSQTKSKLKEIKQS